MRVLKVGETFFTTRASFLMRAVTGHPSNYGNLCNGPYSAISTELRSGREHQSAGCISRLQKRGQSALRRINSLRKHLAELTGHRAKVSQVNAGHKYYRPSSLEMKHSV